MLLTYQVAAVPSFVSKAPQNCSKKEDLLHCIRCQLLVAEAPGHLVVEEVLHRCRSWLATVPGPLLVLRSSVWLLRISLLHVLRQDCGVSSVSSVRIG